MEEEAKTKMSKQATKTSLRERMKRKREESKKGKGG